MIWSLLSTSLLYIIDEEILFIIFHSITRQVIFEINQRYIVIIRNNRTETNKQEKAYVLYVILTENPHKGHNNNGMNKKSQL